MWVFTVLGEMKSLLAIPLAVLPLAISLRISASRSDNTNSLATSLHISSISEGLTGALVRSIILCSRLVIGINKKANKQIPSTASGSVATCASEGVISKINAIPFPITMPNRADTTDKVKTDSNTKVIAISTRGITLSSPVISERCFDRFKSTATIIIAIQVPNKLLIHPIVTISSSNGIG